MFEPLESAEPYAFNSRYFANRPGKWGRLRRPLPGHRLSPLGGASTPAGRCKHPRWAAQAPPLGGASTPAGRCKHPRWTVQAPPLDGASTPAGRCKHPHPTPASTPAPTVESRAYALRADGPNRRGTASIIMQDAGKGYALECGKEQSRGLYIDCYDTMFAKK